MLGKKIISTASSSSRNLIQSNRYEPSDPILDQTPDFVGRISVRNRFSWSYCSATLVQANNADGETFKAVVTAASCLFKDDRFFDSAIVNLKGLNGRYTYTTSIGLVSPNYSFNTTSNIALLEFKGPSDSPAASLNMNTSAPAVGSTMALSGFGGGSLVGENKCNTQYTGRTEYTQYQIDPAVNLSSNLIYFSWNKNSSLSDPGHFGALCPGDLGGFIGAESTLYATASFQNSMTPLLFGGTRVAEESWLSSAIASGNYTSYSDIPTPTPTPAPTLEPTSGPKSAHHSPSHLGHGREAGLFFLCILSIYFVPQLLYIGFKSGLFHRILNQGLDLTDQSVRRTHRIKKKAADIFNRIQTLHPDPQGSFVPDLEMNTHAIIKQLSESQPNN